MEINNTILSLTTIFLLLLSTIGYSQSIASPQHIQEDRLERFQNYTTEDGLPNNMIVDLMQDQFGFIWIATNYGLSQFNGVEFINYYHQKGDSTSLSDNRITCLLEDQEGTIWVGTKNGLNRLNRRDHTFQQFFNDKRNPTSLPSNYIRTLFSDEKNVIWLETDNGNLSRYQTNTQRFQNFPHEPPELRYTSHKIKRRKNGNLLVAGRKIIPKEFDVATQSFKPLPNIESLHRYHFISDIIEMDGYQVITNSSNRTYITDQNFQNSTLFEDLSSVYDVLEDTKGQLWFGGYGGLARRSKDGTTLTKFLPSPEREDALLHRIVFKILEDQSGNIWAATYGGLCKLTPNQFISHIQHPTASNNIMGITKGSDTTIWLGTADQGISLYDFKNHTYLKQLTTPSLISNKIRSLHLDKEGILWIGHWSGLGIQTYDTKKGKFQDYRLCSTTPIDWYNAILETKKGEIYVGSWGRGPVKFDKKAQDLSNEHWVPSYQQGHAISNFQFWEDQIIWLHAHLLYAYQPKDKTYKILHGDPTGNPCKPMSNPLVYHITPPWDYKNKFWNYHFQNNTLWVTSLKGVFQFTLPDWKGSRSAINQFSNQIIDIAFKENFAFLLTPTAILKIEVATNKRIAAYPLPQTISADPYSFEGNKTKLLIGDEEWLVQHQQHLYKYQTNIKKWTSTSFDKPLGSIQTYKNETYLTTKDAIYLLSNDSLHSIKVDHPNMNLLGTINGIAITKDKEIWCGTDKGLFLLNTQQNKATVYFHEPTDTSSLPDDKVYQVRIKEDGSLWVATQKGLAQFDPNTTSFIRHNQNTLDGLSSWLTKSLLEDHQGNIWVGNTTGSLDVYDPNKKQFRHFLPDPQREDALQPDPDGYLHCLFEDSQNRLWIGGGSLGLFHPTTKSFTNYKNTDGEAFSKVISIQEGNKGKLWLSTNKGIYLFDTEATSFTYFGMEDNIQGLNFNAASCRLPNGEIVFGGTNGFNIIDINNLPLKSNTTLAAKLFQFKADTQYIPELATDTTITISSNSFQLDIAMDAFVKGNQYQYRLEGFEDDWTIQEATNSTISYNNLPYGEYTLRVIPGNAFTGWSKQEQRLQLHYIAPFYQTTNFKVLSFLAVSFLIFLLTRFLYVRSSKRRAARKAQEEQAKRLSSQLQFLQLKSIQTQMNPHFIFNVLQSVQNSIVNKQLETANQQVVDLSLLIRHFLEASVSMDMGEKGNFSHEIPLEQELELLQLYVQFEHKVYEEKFNYSFEVPQEIAEGNYTLPPMLIQPIVENAIKHGLLPKKDPGNLSIRFKALADEGLQCDIEDDGIGRFRSKEMKKHSKRQFKSRGFHLVEDKINLLNQTGYAITINTTDKPNHTGTLVTLIINRNYHD